MKYKNMVGYTVLHYTAFHVLCYKEFMLHIHPQKTVFNLKHI